MVRVGEWEVRGETHYYSRTVSCELAWKKRENIIIYSWSLTAIRTLCVHVRTRMQNWKNAHQSVWCHSRTFYACGDSKFDVNVNLLYTSNDTIRPCTTHHFPRGTSVTHSDWLISHLISNVSNYFDWLKKISPKLELINLNLLVIVEFVPNWPTEIKTEMIWSNFSKTKKLIMLSSFRHIKSTVSFINLHVQF